MLESKNSIRKEMLLKRRELTQYEVDSKSKVIFEKLIKTDIYIAAKNVLTYYSFNNEVSTLNILSEKSRNIYLPKVIANNGLSIHKYVSSNDLTKSNYGIMEPTNKPIVNIELIDLVVVPLVAFDNALHRIGYGGGYYDRLLKKIPNCYKIGIAYELQNIHKIDKEHHDYSLDMVITESNTYIENI